MKSSSQFSFYRKNRWERQVLFVVLFLFVSIHSFAQDFYSSQWKIIENNEKQGKVKSNQSLVDAIQKQAMKDKNFVELVKATKYNFSIKEQTFDDENNNLISVYFKELEELKKSLSGEEKLMYEALLGNLFLEYFEDEEYEISERTNIDLQDTSKIESWSNLSFKNYLKNYFEAMNAKKVELSKIQLSKYKDIFKNNTHVEYLPTAYDYVAYQEIAFLGNRSLFTVNEIKENKKKIAQIYDDLIANNTGNVNLFIQHQKVDFECEQNCDDKLNKLLSLVNTNSIDGDYKLAIVADIIELYAQNKQGKKGIEIAELFKAKYPQSKFIVNVENSERIIKEKRLTVSYEMETQAKKPIHLVVSGKNLSAFELRIFEVKNDDEGFLKFVSDSYNHPLSKVKKTLYKKVEFPVNFTTDYNEHSTSIVLEALPTGLYVGELWVEGEKSTDYAFIVNDTRLVYDKMNKQAVANSLRLVSNEDGSPIKSSSVEYLNYLRSKGIEKGAATTSNEGVFSLKRNGNSYYNYYFIKSKGNNYNLITIYGRDYYETSPVEKTKFLTQIYLDRAIYRPGQVVYFKAISTKAVDKVEQVNPNFPLEIKLVDANGEEVSKQNLTTNEFGSVSGSFTLPAGKLNGTFYINVLNKEDTYYKNFRVEEYKRPKFEVTFEKIKGEYKYGETLEIKGKALSYSGIPLSNAKVNFEIKKEDIRYRYFYRYPQNYNNENSILGSATTNDKGEFSYQLKLEKDSNKKGIQIHNYKVEASVTDVNGETQSALENITVASVSHYITASGVPTLFSDQNVEVEVSTNNYSGEKLGKSYQFSLEKLKGDSRVYRSNFKDHIQDLPQLSEADFHKNFPHDYYSKKEKDQKSEVLSLVKKATEKSEKLNLGRLEPGLYKLKFFNIEGKDTIQTSQEFEVFSKSKLDKTQNPYLKVVAPKGPFIRGEKVKIHLYSAVENAKIIMYSQDGLGNTITSAKTISKGVLVDEITIPQDKSIKQMQIQYQLVAFNDVQMQTVSLPIKEETNQLSISTEVFRDKLELGQKEKWTVKVNGNDKEKITAEVLASMYDKSLDIFAVNRWNWGKILWDSSVFHSYLIRSDLRDLYFSGVGAYKTPYHISLPEFSWMNEKQMMYFKSVTHAAVAYDAVAGSVEREVAMAVPSPVRMAKNGKISDTLKTQEIEELVYHRGKSPSEVKIRTNLSETAFFYPTLKTDENGSTSFEFTAPEALTKWKVQFLAHTKDARGALLEKEMVTQKEFSVTPNYPRFLREGDELVLQSKLSNLSDKILNGSSSLQILDAFTNEDISSKFSLNDINKSFTLNANGNSVVDWTVKVPNSVSAIIIKVVAKAGNFSDGEQMAIPVLPNRMLVTDAVPIFVKEGQSKSFTLDALKNMTSSTVGNVSTTLELTTNPVWELLFSLPSLKDDQGLSAEVQFNKWFADVLASELFKANPRMKTVFDEYQQKGLLTSNLEKNQELKQLLLEETPWVLESKSETEQMQKLARLFDANSMRFSIQEDWNDLRKLQNSDGGFSWYPGYGSSYSVSLYILKNLGKISTWLKGNMSDYQNESSKELLANLVGYLDSEINRYYKSTKSNAYSNFVIDYLDARKYFESDYPLKGQPLQIKKDFLESASNGKIQDYTFYGLHRAALLFDQFGKKEYSSKILTYLKETSTQSQTQGAYWKKNLNDWGWYASGEINHAGALEAFEKLTPKDSQFIEELKIWLIIQKEVNRWSSSRATAEVIFTILSTGKSWTTQESDDAKISWGGKSISPQTNATGYLKQTVAAENLDKSLATVSVSKSSPGVVQGGLFWQYYEDLDKIKSSESYISISKELYKKVKTVNGEELKKITSESELKVGDKVTVRMLLNSNRPMEFVHLKDMRAAGFEPVDVLSAYQWKNNLGYYQVTKDASTNFYIEFLPKGKFVFEYDYICNAAGTFSNGITTLQNYYAPQMNAHTQGSKVKITH